MAIFEPQLTAAQSDALATLMDLVQTAFRRPSQTTPLRRDGLGFLPTSSGVYGVYRDGRLIYVGEGGSLKARVMDLFQTRHHSLRRTLGQELYGDRPGFQPATTKRPFSPEIEAELTMFSEEHLSVLVVPLKLGRKEIEERLVAEVEGLLNQRGQRGVSAKDN